MLGLSDGSPEPFCESQQLNHEMLESQNVSLYLHISTTPCQWLLRRLGKNLASICDLQLGADVDFCRAKLNWN